MVTYDSTWIRFDSLGEKIPVEVVDLKKTQYGKDYLVLHVEGEDDQARLINIAPFQVEQVEVGHRYHLTCTNQERNFIKIDEVKDEQEEHPDWLVHDTIEEKQVQPPTNPSRGYDPEDMVDLQHFLQYKLEEARNNVEQYQKLLILVEGEK